LGGPKTFLMKDHFSHVRKIRGRDRTMRMPTDATQGVVVAMMGGTSRLVRYFYMSNKHAKRCIHYAITPVPFSSLALINNHRCQFFGEKPHSALSNVRYRPKERVRSQSSSKNCLNLGSLDTVKTLFSHIAPRINPFLIFRLQFSM
jgi:hypothetical protein